MIYLSLPYMEHNLTFNNFLKSQINLERIKPESIFKEQFEIEMTYGSFPFCYWNGDINSNYNEQKFPLYREFHDLFSETTIPICCDCSNINLTQEDLLDTHQNIIIEAGQDAGNYIEISSLSVLKYINNNYSNYEFILSKNADLIHRLTPEIINTFLEEKIFYSIVLPLRFKNNIEELKQIQHKNRVTIIIGSKCPQCNSMDECALQEQCNQYNYYGYTKYSCDQMNNYNNMDELITEIKYFQKLGFSHFRVDSPPLNKNNNFKIYLIMNLVKPQYQLSIINYLINSGVI